MERTFVWRFLHAICRIAAVLWFNCRAYGVKNVPRKGGVLLVSNHQSYLDPVLLAIPLPRMVSYLAKSELFEHKALAWLIRSLNAFPVRQGRVDTTAVKEMIRRLRAGELLNLYP